MGYLRRAAVLATATLLGAAAAITAAAPAQAAPMSIDFNNVTGTTHLAKPNVDVTVPTSSVKTMIDLDTKTVTGSVNLSDLTAKLKLANLIGVTSTVKIVPVGDLSGTIDLGASKLSTTSKFTLQVTNVHKDALPKLNLVKKGCRTVRPSTLTLNNTSPVELFKPITMEGTYTIPPFTGCGLLTPLLTLLLSGPNNTMKLDLI
ncbi:hypothetical protein AMIS_32790 [Actinoplanes missouriensis 431]|uniref:Uncharacterized protein n=1 Tax=Actinoplanes missouriensis (strain ATCC 14538 / DSM 43046 / CBS 188.64 / JCM 3121 / NBRC 102363 / NCIMB 12654 / NRRL B-3342 / UNCC 431) TaxID=512565 RepID=I0H662_ACTM4|nr:hypothetical protein [Actinoplanes missouriensis]BAL88499.1 hypothetical protein AMIS_32790 [Actinoplanes missouriensis 431]